MELFRRLNYRETCEEFSGFCFKKQKTKKQPPLESRVVSAPMLINLILVPPRGAHLTTARGFAFLGAFAGGDFSKMALSRAEIEKKIEVGSYFIEIYFRIRNATEFGKMGYFRKLFQI